MLRMLPLFVAWPLAMGAFLHRGIDFFTSYCLAIQLAVLSILLLAIATDLHGLLFLGVPLPMTPAFLFGLSYSTLLFIKAESGSEMLFHIELAVFFLFLFQILYLGMTAPSDREAFEQNVIVVESCLHSIKEFVSRGN